jgi:anti-sigma factor RsiW
MISPINENEVSDVRLVAYLDDQLPPADRAAVARALEQNAELRQRMEFLDSGGRPFSNAFDLLLEAAPDQRLQAMFADLLNGQAAAPATPPADEKVVPLRRPPWAGMRPVWQMAAAASIALTMFGVGIVAGVILKPQPTVITDATRNWMEAVAQYVSLFSEQTLAGMPADPAAREAGLRRVSTALGLDISREKLASLPALDFRGTQLLQLEGRPLAQIAFMSDTGKPVAICIIKTTKPAEPPSPERRHGLNLVHWVANGYGFMVIGDVPQESLRRIYAETFARFS